MELKLGKKIRKLEFVAEENYQTSIIQLSTYLNCAWNLPVKCTRISSLFTAYLVSGHLRPFTLFCFTVLSSCLSYPQLEIPPF